MTVAFAAILVGLGGAFVVRQHLHKPELPPLPQLAVDDDIIVPVALTDLEAGRTLTINDVARVRMSRDKFAKSPYAGQSFLRVSEQIANRTLKTSMKQGDAFLAQNLYPEGMGPDLAQRLQAGYRAVTVPIANVGAVQGFARSGSIVDVLFRVEATEAEDRPQETMTLLERVEVLAIDTYTQPGQQVELEQDGTVTLAVTPHQAKMLKVVEGRGELSLTLRNPEDQFEFVPFDLGTEGGVSQADPQFGAVPVSFLADRTGRTDIDSDDVRAVGNLDRAIGHASERVTLDDLLGWAPRPKKVQMEVFLGAQREVKEFEEYNTKRVDVLRQGGRIRTPIAGAPAVPSGSTVQVDHTSSQFAKSGAAGQ
jgi:pilus assembly protein CpaB